jgi:hypothetical protein
MKHPEDIYRVPSIVLSIVGAYELLRGFIPTFLQPFIHSFIHAFIY